MADEAKIEARFWKELKASPFLMLGLDGVRDGHTQPMTAQLDGDEEKGPLYFFTSNDNGIVMSLGQSSRAIATFTGKGHDLFASIHGNLSVDNDAATIDRLWSSYVEAWFEGGREDPKVTLLRLDLEKAAIWLGGSTIGAALTQLFGADPKQTYKDNMAEVTL
jgi:general stress protein 26